MHITPRFLTLPGDSPLEASHPVPLTTPTSQELAEEENKPRAHHHHKNSTAVSRTAASLLPPRAHSRLPPPIQFSMQCPAVRISNERENTRNHINQPHGNICQQIFIIPEPIFTPLKLSASAKDAYFKNFGGGASCAA